MKGFNVIFPELSGSSWGRGWRWWWQRGRALCPWSRHFTPWYHTRVRSGLEDFGRWEYGGALTPDWVGFLPKYKNSNTVHNPWD